MKRIFPIILGLLFLASCTKDEVTVIWQISDPQLGFEARNANMDYEIGTFTAAVDAVNRTHPDAVVFTGDLVHDCWNEDEWDGFRKIENELDHEIRKFYIPGNHDIVFKDGFDMTPYVNHIGSDRFNAVIGGVMLTGINTDYIKYVEGSEEELEQMEWIKEVLMKKQDGQLSIVFGHHPFFLTSPDEKEEYFNIRPDNRNKYLKIFETEGVDAVFCGHKHDNYVTSDGDIPVVITSAIGKPLGEAPSGIRAIVVRNGVLKHAYFTPDEVPSSREALVKQLFD